MPNRSKETQTGITKKTSSTRKNSFAELEKRVQTQKKKNITKQKTSSAIKTSLPSTMQKPNTTDKKKVKSVISDTTPSAFQVRTSSIGSTSKVQEKDKNAPTRMMVLFFFSLAFLLFSLYKVFIYGRGYDFSLDLENKSNSHIVDIDPLLLEATSDSSEDISDRALQPDFEHGNQDLQTIHGFYDALANGEIERMNSYIDRPLLNSQVWKQHRSKKNIGIFNRNIGGTLAIKDIFLIPGSTNAEKKSKSYSYVLHYTLQSGEKFEEDWEVVLVDRNGKMLISAIMCTTTGCSRSPFFWPQNYNLK